MPVTPTTAVNVHVATSFRISYMHADSAGPAGTDTITVPFEFQAADGSWIEYKRVTYDTMGANKLGAIMANAGALYTANVAAGQAAALAFRNAIRAAIYQQAQADGVLPAGAIS